MPRKAYQADLKSAAQGVAAGISHVRAGDDDGEFKIRITPEGGKPFEISALIPDLGDYPTEHVYQIFVADDDAPSFVGETLEQLPNTQGRKIEALLDILSKTFVPADRDGDALMIDSQAEDCDGDTDDDDDDDDDFGAGFSDDDDDDDDAFDIDGSARHLSRSSAAAQASTTSNGGAQFRDRLRADLNVTKAAGFRVGAIGGAMDGHSCYITVACRVSKLGISEEAMEAWQLRGNEYLVLIIHFPNGYKTVDDVEGYDATGARRNIEFRVGCCDHYKPTVQEAIAVFDQCSANNKQRAEHDPTTSGKPTRNGFRENFISRPLNQLLNDRLPTILRYRLTGMSWTGAEKIFNDFQGKNIGVDGTDFSKAPYLVKDAVNTAYPPIVTADHLVEVCQPHSLLLLAMQFLLRHFVRCTEFCLVCHCKLDHDLEAIKPYVCDKPLCLYQYMSLGFGPSIEHEIIAQPFVVDLLLSFCYSQAAANRLKELPTGLSLSVPRFITPQPPPAPVASVIALPHVSPDVVGMKKARYNTATSELLFEKGQSPKFGMGDWLMVILEHKKETKVFHCQVKEMVYLPTVKVSAPITPPLPGANQNLTSAGFAAPNLFDGISNSTTPSSVLNVPEGFHDVRYQAYELNFDTLSVHDQSLAILRLLELIPPVQELREHLLRYPDTTLSLWHERLSPAVLAVLRWIIASNRACIMQPSGSGKKCEYRVHGMKNWMQFRFAMGAPDKERRFVDAVQATSQRKKLTHPTIYAWHGSPLYNWHSIIREGLHFKNADHGRAFGNGVYHSLDYHTSSGYSGAWGYLHQTSSHNPYGGAWPNSVLKIATAMALNEIVNAPDEYVSRTPHLVVAQLDWIQTRFLFVKVTTDEKLFDQEENVLVEFHAQDPGFTPKGENGLVRIPVNATRARRNKKTTAMASKKSVPRGLFGSKKGTASDPIGLEDDDESVATDAEDRNLLLEEGIDGEATTQGASRDKELPAKVGGFRSIFGAKSSSSSVKPPPRPMDFVPGSLDHGSLPVLKAPEFATTSATKRLQKDFQSLVRLQQSAVAESTLHELGWWVDPEMFSNVYQWIVELHSFDESLPLTKQLKRKDLKSIVMEMRFGPDYPMSPPFIRVIRPRFKSFMQGGGGHVTADGSLCMELLTNSGWSAVSSIESILLQVRMAISSTDPRPAQLDEGVHSDYGVSEAIDAYIRACNTHGWRVPDNFRQIAWGGQNIGGQY